MTRLHLLALAALILAGCAPKVITVEKPVIQNVEVRVECPSKQERDRLKALRPVPLRNQPMPETAVERVARIAAQLGKYEAEGGYSDQIGAALDRCQGS